MSNDAQEYNLAAIRQLLLAAFTAEELRRFCYDRPEFRPVVNRFGPGHGYDDMVDELIVYCDAYMLLPELLGEIKHARPRQYARFLELPDTTESARMPPPGPPPGLLYRAPSPLDGFVGREAEIQRLTRTLRPGAKIAIVGTGGLGKTELAKVAAYRMAWAFRDGVLWAACGHQDMSVIADIWAAEFGVQLSGNDLQTKAAAWRGLISAKEVLLVFDSVQPGQEVEVLFSPSGRGAALLTTRQMDHPALRGTERLLLTPFNRDEALELAQRLLGSDVTRRQSGWLFDLLHRVAGLPLQLAVLLSLVPEYYGSLNHLCKKLDVAGAETPDIVWEIAWKSLPTELQDTFGTLALFNEGPSFSTHALAETMDLAEPEAEARLRHLTKHSLLAETESMRWTLHDELRRFIAERAHVDETASMRMARHYLGVARAAEDLYQQGGEELLLGLARFTLEWPHIWAGQAWAAARTDSNQEAAQLCSDYADTATYYSSVRLSPREWIVWLESAVHAARQLGDKKAEGQRLSSLGNACVELGEIRRAIEFQQQAAIIHQQTGNRRAESDDLSNLGVAWLRLGYTGRAIDYHQQALTAHREIGDQRGQGNDHANLGVAYSKIREFGLAIEHYEAALVIYREIGARLSEGAVLANLGRAVLLMGNALAAVDYYKRAISIGQEIGDRRSEGNWLAGLGAVYAALDDTGQAIEFYEQALAIHREIGDSRGEGADLRNLGGAYADVGEVQRAIKYYEQALVIYREIGDRRSEGDILSAMGNTYDAVGDVQRSIALYEAALTTYRSIDSRSGEGNTLSSLGRAHASLEMLDSAIKYYEEALEIHREIGDRLAEGNNLGSLGQAYFSRGNPEEAIKYYENALVIHREIGNQSGEGTDLSNLGTAHMFLGAVREAADYFKKALCIDRKIGDLPGEEQDLANLGAVYGSLGELQQAIEHYEQALSICRRLGARDRESRYLATLGRAHQDLDEVQVAIEYYKQALDISRELDDHSGEKSNLRSLALLYWTMDDIEQALSHYQQMADVYRQDKELDKVAETLVSMGNLARDHEQFDRAEQYWLHCRYLYTELDSPLVQSVDALLSELESLRPVPFSLEETAQRFLRSAGFELDPGDEQVGFFCRPQDRRWQRRFSQPIPAQVVSASRLDGERVRALCKSLAATSGDKSVVFVFIDQAPTDDGWLQIATMRAEGIQVVPIDDAVLFEGQEKRRERQVLEKHLQGILGRQQDLYNVRHPVADRLNFFGREVLADELMGYLDEGYPVALFGLRKMGKSSMLKYMRDKLPYPTAIVDLEAGTDLQHLYERILTSWACSVQVKVKGGDWSSLKLSDTTDVSSAFSAATRQLLTYLKDQGLAPRVCLLVDEMEVIFPYEQQSAERYLAFTRTLRGLVQEQDGGFSLLVSSLDPSFNRVNRLAGQQNPFYQFFREIYLPALGLDDCMRMICVIGRQMGLEYTEEAARFVAEISGGHPFLARQLCSLAFQELGRDGDVPRSHLGAVAERFIREPGKVELLDESGLWGEISDPELWPKSQAMENQAILLSLSQIEPQLEPDLVARAHDHRACERSLDEMEKRDILGKPQATLFHIQLRLFRDWIRRYKLMGSG